MPTSWYQATPAIIDLVLLDQPASILDVGIGFGKYGVLLREALDIPYERYEKKDWLVKIDGIEGFKPYQNPIHQYVYNEMYYDEVYTAISKLQQNYDTVLLIDVLEHFEKAEGFKLLEDLLEITNTSLIVSTPIIPAPQEEYLGNTLEKHKSRWTVVDFSEFDYHFSQVNVHGNGANIIKIYPRKSKKKNDLIHLSKNPLKIGYILPHHGLTGGVKMLLHQMEKLKKRGHHIVAFFKGEEGSSVLPPWAEISVDEEVLVPPLALLDEYTEDCDIVVVGWIYQILEFKREKTKIFYWEQGHESLFGDIPNYAHINGIRHSLDICYNSGAPIASVSSFVAKVLKARYSIDSPVITNGIDTSLFKPKQTTTETEFPIILLVGSPSLRFKGFTDALEALEQVWERGLRFQVKWICQHGAEHNTVFPIQYMIQPHQKEIVETYQQANLLLFTSWYEGFGLPPLEAMACGTPVVLTNSGGVQEYAVHHYNCLLHSSGDVHGLAKSVTTILTNDSMSKRLRINGIATAQKFSYDQVIPQLEKYIQSLL
ncbi:glycosyltransferase [Virgibacillus chiguensis]|uniref:Glycosyltransferase involved in cell wall bisynthesis n=1 Tax=Virgibacillus chiguensis TaxID=411959 RepID=A0A1M5TVQ4_9BACI|nr:glycosyltransferase [Virgibacillus chiguensis]SHH54867.1 Glycosyltransferase involved in cell wall bisynthesis [Virgibacillus chiguensis]